MTGFGGRTDGGIERGRGELIRAASNTASGGSAHNSSPFMTSCTFCTGCGDPAWQSSQPFMSSEAGEGFLAGGVSSPNLFQMEKDSIEIWSH